MTYQPDSETTDAEQEEATWLGTSSDGEVVIVCTRDPDFANEFEVFGSARIIDIDAGADDLSDLDTFEEWYNSHLDELDDLPEGHPARAYVVSVIDGYRERYHS